MHIFECRLHKLETVILTLVNEKIERLDGNLGPPNHQLVRKQH